MKKSIKFLSALLAAALLSFMVSACAMEWHPIGSNSFGNSSSMPAESAPSNGVYPAPSSSAPSVIDSSTSSSSAINSALTEDDAIKISLRLYNEGYMPFMGFLWGGGDSETGWDWDKMITYDGWRYYLYTKYPTRKDIEEAFAAAFTDDFVNRNVSSFFESDADGRLMFIEQNGNLYRIEPGGIGGTYELAVDTIKTSNMNTDGWTFTMYGIDPHSDGPLEDLTCTFTVVQDKGQWLISGFERGFSDGSGHSVY